ncbi:MAG: hypothetical protein ACI91B_004935 [Planctomycetota bacterium]|jgi:hypothetical protein
MTGSNERERARELTGAREREFDSLLEQEFGSEPPIAAILHRVEHGPQLATGTRSRSWLAAAMALLGIGVAVALAWNARVDRDDHNSAAPQDPSTPVDVSWPNDVSHVYRVEDLQNVPADATHLELAIPLHVAGDLSRLTNLQHLRVSLSIRTLGKLIREGSEAKVRGRLDALATTPALRTLSIHSLTIAPVDLTALRHLKQLQHLELGVMFHPDQDLYAQAAAGGNLIGTAFDHRYGKAVTTFSRAKTLRLSGTGITADGLQALVDANLHSLILQVQQVTPKVLLALGELTSLRHLELHSVHSNAVPKAVGGNFVRMASRALSVAVMKRLATLPKLRSLTFALCFLDHDFLAALPRQLQQLDISSCFGVDGRLAGIVAAMPELRAIGLPLKMSSAEDFMSMLRPPLRDANIHMLRLSGDEAFAIIANRVWQALHLDGCLTKPVMTALADQPGLQTLTLTPTSGSESLAFVAKLPKLHRITFVQASISEQLLQPLNDCASLRSVDFNDCLIGREKRQLNGVLRDDIVTRWHYRAAW